MMAAAGEDSILFLWPTVDVVSLVSEPSFPKRAGRPAKRPRTAPSGSVAVPAAASGGSPGPAEVTTGRATTSFADTFAALGCDAALSKADEWDLEEVTRTLSGADAADCVEMAAEQRRRGWPSSSAAKAIVGAWLARVDVSAVAALSRADAASLERLQGHVPASALARALLGSSSPAADMATRALLRGEASPPLCEALVLASLASGLHTNRGADTVTSAVRILASPLPDSLCRRLLAAAPSAPPARLPRLVMALCAAGALRGDDSGAVDRVLESLRAIGDALSRAAIRAVERSTAGSDRGER